MPNSTAGLEDVVAADSRICDLDGKLGKLSYFGVDIHDLANSASFEETAYLLWHGVLPTRVQLEEMQVQLRANRALPKPLLAMMRLLPKETRPMDVLRTMVSALAAFVPDAHNITETARVEHALHLTAIFPTIIATWERLRKACSTRAVSVMLWASGTKAASAETIVRKTSIGRVSLGNRCIIASRGSGRARLARNCTCISSSCTRVGNTPCQRR